MSPPDRLVELGYVQRAHGVRGVVRIRAGETLFDLETVDIGGRPYTIREVHPERDAFLVTLEGVTDRDQAEALVGKKLMVPRSALPAPEDDEVYIGDLPGCAVISVDGEALGTVRATEEAAQVLLVVTGKGGNEFLVPFVEPLVVAVDLEARTITVDLPPGLVNLADAETA